MSGKSFEIERGDNENDWIRNEGCAGGVDKRRSSRWLKLAARAASVEEFVEAM